MTALLIVLMLLRQEAPSMATDEASNDDNAPNPQGNAGEREDCIEGPRSGAWTAAAPVTKTRDTCVVVRQLGETAL
jgi:hypothetical protein